jgi:hypothetical protein
MPKVGQTTAPKPTCIACGGTGTNSKGGRCYPCERREMLEWLRKPVVVDLSSLFDGMEDAEGKQTTT